MEYLKNKVVCVLVVKNLEGLQNKIRALVADGFDVFEVTLRTDVALDAIRSIKRDFPSLKVGAGTILNVEQLDESICAGADFGVSPGLNELIISKSKERNFDFIPGVATPTEIERAIALGLCLVKLFPAKLLGGVEYIQAISGPYRNMYFMPTGGVNESTAKDYLDLDNVLCVGGSWMF
ncbi:MULTISPECIES: bifunctional 4-hydroxy-2-oxoglutarate aldolase/2-dehydro-3-deoxy-phosphogluconate aldolase [unclassified Oleiphilus]|jgi:2-dehydro-3-deoxyphosphogluconate aldolase/(4S)-4-hydroxy-2-oxoglutarate aldolase|uniref:bifunctional 4-hydroxy-2-oxoglutarate aldolase/2-dehydro-3-deoxy-phosphogluconate aldolase n=1 Tax=unclassified Oleiphilus TaxID=2631174 RepID=UPI0007C24C8F|nr:MULTISPECIES: bifunctional 4-hydroxy-2-oxoglutarate aldolase/2-dehydro-3-deoxy-phosphogluconate aldolase [unclassified Oleiphilus]KZY43992.1 hypothetical protein A3732_01795 [Oleiphilus sp. HI0050]KZY83799.1 hypothetical protein A3740_05150 [Oleiphilus sp. HI0068]KZY86566.1 hypothetical protein A3741_14390 [Oleiphilus sp. HI0069]KZY88513.1 hypothetical protein A3743_11530 [Oleiphilus sp. HI0072]KZZ09488.1 hypothetical protein A3749_01770 [Oleiphilus sp. HI0078]KZZ19822.1 hypothetical prote